MLRVLRADDQVLMRTGFRLILEAETDLRVADTVRFTSPPQLVELLLFGVLGPIARATGHRGLDPAYLQRELPTVDLEPLPAEIIDLIPGLAAQPTSGET